MNIVAKTANVKPIKCIIPMFLASMFAGIAEKIALRKKQIPMFTPYSMKVLKDNCNFSHQKLTALTGYNPMPLEQSLRDHTLFYIEHRTK